MNKINLESDLLTEKGKFGLVTYFVCSVIIALTLWFYDWSIFALLCHSFAIQYALSIYKAEVFYNTKNGNKEFIKKWLIFLLVVLVFAAMVLAYLDARYSSLFVIGMATLQAFEVDKLTGYDKKQNGNLSKEPGIFEKHYSIKNLLMLLGVMIYGFLAYQFFSVLFFH